MPDAPKLYTELASWFHLMTRPEDYAEEADFARKLILESFPGRSGTVLELGSGGGNNAFHLKRDFQLTLSDVSPDMLETSRRINPECEHVVGDMRGLRLGRRFDAVFVHDAIGYMLRPADLRAALATAREHCRPDGVLVVMPDYMRETFRPGVHHGGHDGVGRSLRYFEWTFDPDPQDSTYTVDFVYMLRQESAPVRVIHDPHTCGLFPRDLWLQLLREEGFAKLSVVADPWGREVLCASSASLR
jgi:SAM-dependent methyltransferase